MPRFAGRAEEREEAKRERLAPAIREALARREPARPAPAGYVVKPDGEPAPARGPRPPDEAGAAATLRGLAARAGRVGLAALVRGRSDAQLHRMFDRGPVLPLVFGRMEKAFIPEKARGFEGEVLYELRTSGGVRRWTVRIADEAA